MTSNNTGTTVFLSIQFQTPEGHSGRPIWPSKGNAETGNFHTEITVVFAANDKHCLTVVWLVVTRNFICHVKKKKIHRQIYKTSTLLQRKGWAPAPSYHKTIQHLSHAHHLISGSGRSGARGVSGSGVKEVWGSGRSGARGPCTPHPWTPWGCPDFVELGLKTQIQVGLLMFRSSKLKCNDTWCKFPVSSVFTQCLEENTHQLVAFVGAACGPRGLRIRVLPFNKAQCNPSTGGSRLIRI